MERWVGKVAVVTGASSGIGAAIVVDLLKAGVVVVGLARRVERVEELRGKVSARFSGSLHAIKCDITKEEDILAAFEWVEQTLGGVDILVNNAGVSREINLVDKGNTQALREVLDTNVVGLVQCSRGAFQSMKARNVDGHVVLINSILGHSVPWIRNVGSHNIYAGSKYAVTAITEVLRQEFLRQNINIKISYAMQTPNQSISPGVVDTEIIQDDWKAKKLPYLNAKDVSASVLHVIGTPPHVQIHELIIKPVGEQF